MRSNYTTENDAQSLSPQTLKINLNFTVEDYETEWPGNNCTHYMLIPVLVKVHVNKTKGKSVKPSVEMNWNAKNSICPILTKPCPRRNNSMPKMIPCYQTFTASLIYDDNWHYEIGVIIYFKCIF